MGTSSDQDYSFDEPGEPRSGGPSGPPPRTRGFVRTALPRVAAAITFACAGFLGVTSASAAHGTDLRAERQSDLSDLVKAQSQRADLLNSRLDDVTNEVGELSQQIGGSKVEGLEKDASRLEPTAGLTSLEGPGLTISLDDAPPEMRQGQQDLDALVVHQQDIQAVVNAMWAGGAEAVTIQGQRLISTSAIRCVGNSVVLEKVPYPPPYRISAVGDVDRMLKEIYDSSAVAAYLDAVDHLQLGWDIQRHNTLQVPAFKGKTELDYATTD
ncbi:DUF881 domain-containing protein [Flindersiella endophytica]